MPAGRPSLFTKELADAICERLAGGESMRTVCLDDSMPCMATVFKWLREIPEFTQQYAKAKEECHAAWFEEIMDIADDGSNDWMEYHYGDSDENVGWKVNGEALQRSRLRVDTRKWALSKLMPKKYGDRIYNEHGGSVGLHQMTDEELARAITEREQQLQRASRD